MKYLKGILLVNTLIPWQNSITMMTQGLAFFSIFVVCLAILPLNIIYFTCPFDSYQSIIIVFPWVALLLYAIFLSVFNNSEFREDLTSTFEKGIAVRRKYYFYGAIAFILIFISIISTLWIVDTDFNI